LNAKNFSRLEAKISNQIQFKPITQFAWFLFSILQVFSLFFSSVFRMTFRFGENYFLMIILLGRPLKMSLDGESLDLICYGNYVLFR
jgi:hypothetical protein